MSYLLCIRTANSWNSPYVTLVFEARSGSPRIILELMGELPEVVRIALQNASKSGRALSWKVQENKKGILSQLVWKQPQEICAELKGHTKTSSGTVGSNLNKSKTVAGMSVAAGEPQKRRRNNPSQICRNARRLQHFLDRKASSGNEPPQPVVTSNTAQETANEEHVEQAEADDLKGFII